MNRKRLLSFAIILIILLSATLVFFIKTRDRVEDELTFIYPFRASLFPPEFPPPTFSWIDRSEKVSSWEISLGNSKGSYSVTARIFLPKWQPTPEQWDSIKVLSGFEKISVKLKRLLDENSGEKALEITSFIQISEDEVGAPILYREIPLPFAYAEKHPDSMSFKLVDVGKNGPPHTAMKKFMVCGNCHSFSGDGKTIGLDFDAAHRDKGGYFIADIQDTITFDTSNYLSWNKIQDRNTFGMFSKISPDGRYVATTLKDRVISKNFGLSPEVVPFSQLFFPINGVIAIYDRQTGKIWELPGANSEKFVQSNAYWTPDGKNIVFSRADAFPYRPEDDDNFLLSDPEIVQDFVDRKLEFKFDVCIVPFNEGRGGEAHPIKGASKNGMSNYFPAVSPDGKWLVFCRADNFMLLQPDSRMYIVPLQGGRAKKMLSNLYLMNSWHAWSPNGKWMVFSSKGLSVYTDLMLTHIDKDGNASHPVLIETARKQGRAANYPEFINVPSNYTFDMVYNYVNLDHITRAVMNKDTALAMSLYDDYIAQEQYSLPMEFLYLAKFNFQFKRFAEAEKYALKAYELEPDNKEAQELLANLRRHSKK